jgi:predicted nucleic acid-binding protein
MTRRGVGASAWTDAYLAAFCHATSLVMVTFDRGFAKWPELSLVLLTATEPPPI